MVTAACAPWATVEDVLAQRCNDGDPCGDIAVSDPYVLAGALDDASFLLNTWSAFQYQGGATGCEATVRPVPMYGPARTVPEWSARPGGYSWGMWPTTWGGTYWGPTTAWLDQNGFCCYGTTSPLARTGGCGCGGPSQIGLGAYPILDVVEVLIDGAVVDPAEYRIDDQRWLVRQPAAGATGVPHWPYCQRVDRPDTEEGTWSVTFTYGALVPDIGVRAAIALACALAAERCGGDCMIPGNTASVTKDGVNVQLVRPLEDVIDNLPTAVRYFLAAVNPGRLRRRPRVFSPDLPREVVTPTWP